MPFYICEAVFKQCIAANAGNAQGQDTCNNNVKPKCATQTPPKSPVADSGDGSSSSTTGTGTSKPTQTSGGNTQVTTTSSHGLAGPTLAPLGSGAFAAAMGLMAYLL